jgi:hypothetical protein
LNNYLDLLDVSQNSSVIRPVLTGLQVGRSRNQFAVPSSRRDFSVSPTEFPTWTKLSRSDADHPSPNSVEIKNEWSFISFSIFISFSTYLFMAQFFNE